MGHQPTTLSMLAPVFNGLSLALVIGALIAIRNRRRVLHARLMGGAILSSAAFLVSYLLRHWIHGSVHYVGPAAYRPLYLIILTTHSVLAVAVVPIVLRTAFLGLRDRKESHRKWGRVAAPVWIYVSVTGLIVFGMLYGLS